MASTHGDGSVAQLGVLETTADHAFTPNDLAAASDGWRRPVWLRGMCRDELVDDKWTLKGLLELEPDTAVTAEYYADADRRKPYQHVTKPFSEIAEDMESEPTKWFLAELDFDSVFAKAAARLPALPVLPSDRRHELRLVFFGNDTQSATHFHVHDQAILTHLRGAKKVVLAGPKTTKHLATNPVLSGRPQFSTVGPEAGADALSAFTELVGDEAFEVDLEPGDALFIPVHWWHWVEGKGECLSVTTFWRASVRDWGWPHPGLRASVVVNAARVLGLVRRVLKRNRPA